MFDQVHRAVLSAGTPNGHSDIAAVVAEHRRQPATQKIADGLLHIGHLCLAREELGHRCIFPAQGFQFGLVVGIGQHAHIEYEIGVHGHAALEGKRLENQRQRRMAGTQHFFDLAAKLGRADQPGVDHQCVFAQLGQELALVLDGIGQGLVLIVGLFERQRMAPSRLGESAHQCVGGGIEEHGSQSNVLIGVGGDAGQAFGQAGQRRSAAHVHRDCHLARAVALFQRDERGEQFGRQVVNAVEAQVFQRGERHRFARARHAGDQHQLNGLW